MDKTKNTSAQNAVHDLVYEENSILHGIIRGGREALLDCIDILDERYFEQFKNKVIYSAIKEIFTDGDQISVPKIISKSKDLGIDDIVGLLDDINNTEAASKEDIRSLAKKIQKKIVIKEAINLHKKSIDSLQRMSASESLSEIFSASESAVFELISKFCAKEDEITELKNIVREYVSGVADNPSDNVGIPTPWPQFNESIGGGMRTGVTLIGARSGLGKSFISQITGLYVAGLDIPVLILDTEMEHKDVLPRMLANLSEVDIRKIETGTFNKNEFEKNCVYKSVEQMEALNLSYKSVAGRSFNEIMSLVRRWIYSKVGIDQNGRANQCLIIYDYFKIMDSGDISDMQEYQAMGFQISKLTDFCKKYDFPCMSFVQLNRDGVAKESTDVIAQSDRLLWLCNSFSIFKEKSTDNMDKDGWDKGNRKMITLKSRYGGEHQFGQYISMNMKGSIASILEINTAGGTEQDEPDSEF